MRTAMNALSKLKVAGQVAVIGAHVCWERVVR